LATSTEKKLEEVIEVPEGLEIKLKDDILVIRGPLGEVSRNFTKVLANVSLERQIVKITPLNSRKKYLSTMNTAKSLIKNMINGVTSGFTYKLKIAFAHFPITVKVKGNEVHVENFYGERGPRIAKIVGNCKVEALEEDVIVSGISIDDVGQTAGNIEQATTVKNKDKRIFLDGVYIYEKIRGKK
jgi:large subunit ribosomal protein L6